MSFDLIKNSEFRPLLQQNWSKQEAILRLEDSGVGCDMEYNQCYFKKFHRDEFYIIKHSDIIKDVLSDGDMVEIAVRKTKIKHNPSTSKSCSSESSTLENADEFNECRDTVIDMDGNSLTLQKLMLLSNGEVKLSLSDETLNKIRETRDIGFPLLIRDTFDTASTLDLDYSRKLLSRMRNSLSCSTT